MPEAPPVIEQHYQFAVWLLERSARFPKTYRFSLADRLQEEALEVLFGLLEAAYRREKLDSLRRADESLARLRYLIRISKDLKCLSLRQYEHASHEATEVGAQLGGWMKSVRGR